MDGVYIVKGTSPYGTQFPAFDRLPPNIDNIVSQLPKFDLKHAVDKFQVAMEQNGVTEVFASPLAAKKLNDSRLAGYLLENMERYKDISLGDNLWKVYIDPTAQLTTYNPSFVVIDPQRRVYFFTYEDRVALAPKGPAPASSGSEQNRPIYKILKANGLWPDGKIIAYFEDYGSAHTAMTATECHGNYFRFPPVDAEPKKTGYYLVEYTPAQWNVIQTSLQRIQDQAMRDSHRINPEDDWMEEAHQARQASEGQQQHNGGHSGTMSAGR